VAYALNSLALCGSPAIEDCCSTGEIFFRRVVATPSEKKAGKDKKTGVAFLLMALNSLAVILYCTVRADINALGFENLQRSLIKGIVIVA
jgi:hypothetical protein